MEWVLKSESDTDKVWVEIDGKGEETGNYKYEFPEGEIVETNFLAPKSMVPYVVVAVVSSSILTALVAHFARL